VLVLLLLLLLLLLVEARKLRAAGYLWLWQSSASSCHRAAALLLALALLLLLHLLPLARLLKHAKQALLARAGGCLAAPRCSRATPAATGLRRRCRARPARCHRLHAVGRRLG
jgi:hypothetical protein